jgi:hypothetical protein
MDSNIVRQKLLKIRDQVVLSKAAFMSKKISDFEQKTQDFKELFDKEGELFK